ncbi:hypothetical protein BU073_10690 [Mammaliicoccus vitulinus]|nr:hypothetical protein BU073_10690 [Mammaliicoccus vitulinus]RTX85665.1 hypothetical protein CD108_08965 [Mammaliicoccus vitulinus]
MLAWGMARACSLSHILFPRASALYKIRNIKSPNPKMITMDWVIYFKLGFMSQTLLFILD